MTATKGNVKKITLSLPDEIEEQLRQRAETEYSGIKGALSIIVTKALEEYFEKNQ